MNDHADPRFDPDATLLSARATATPSARANGTPSARANATPSAPVTATSVASEIAGRMRGRARRARTAMGLRGILLLALCIGGGFGFLHAPTLFARERDARMASPTHPPPYPRAALDAETEASHKDREQRDAIRQRIAAHAEGNAKPVRPRLTIVDADTTIIGVHFAARTHGWAVGRDGTILATTDGGLTWRQTDAGTAEFLFSVRFVDTARGWAVGDNGMILASADGGLSWRKQASGVGNALTSVHFSGPEHGWAVGGGGTILATTDGGATWRRQDSGVNTALANVHFVDRLHGWAVGLHGVVLATDDGGATWRGQDSGVTVSLSGVHFTDTKRGWAAGLNGTLVSTADGGATWTWRETGVPHALTDIHFADARRGWVVGRAGTILTTGDAGMTWRQTESGTTNDLYGVHFSDPGQAWAVGGGGTLLTIATPDMGAILEAERTADIVEALARLGVERKPVEPLLSAFTAAQASLATRAGLIETYRRALATPVPAADNATPGGARDDPMGPATLARAGIVVLLLAALLGGARTRMYLMRMSGHHDACADALLLIEAGSRADLADLVRALSPLQGTGVHRAAWPPFPGGKPV